MIDRDVTVDFNADVSGYLASTSQAIALTKEYTSELTNMAGVVAKVGNTVSTGYVDAVSRMAKVNQAGVSSAAAYQQQLSSLEGALTVTGGNFTKLSGQVKALARDLPVGIGGAVRQFEALQKVGVPTAQVSGLAKAFTQLEGATGESGTAMAQMAVQMGRTFNNTGLRGIQNLNDSLVTTSRQFGASATGVLSFANAIGPMAKQAGMAQTQVIGMSTAFSRVGEDGYRAANALTKMMTDMDRSVREGSSEMTIYANTVGKTREEFTQLYKSKPAEALMQVSEALNKMGPDAIRQLEAMGLEGTRTLMSLTAVMQTGQLREQVDTAVGAYGSGSTAEAAEKAFGGLNDQLQTLGETMSQLASTSGEPLLGFMESLAGQANTVAEMFTKIAGSDGIRQLVQIGATLGVVGAAAGGIGSAVSALGLGKMALSSTGAPGRSAAGFLANNKGRLLAAGVGGAALTGLDPTGLGLLAPLLASGFLGSQTLRNAGIRTGEMLFTNVGSQAGVPLAAIARGDTQIPRTRASLAHRDAQRALREAGGTWRERAGLLSTYAQAGPDEFIRRSETILDEYTTPGGAMTGDDLRARYANMAPGGWAPQSRFGQGAVAAGRMVRYGGAGAVRGLVGAGMGAVGGPAGLAVMGGIGLGMMAYNADQTQQAQQEALAERKAMKDSTSALNDLRTALELATVSAHDFRDAIGSGGPSAATAPNTTFEEAYRLTQAELNAAATGTSVMGFQGTAEEQAAQAMAVLGPGADLQMVEAVVADLAAANKGDRSTLDEIMKIMNTGRTGGAAGAGVQAGAAGRMIGGFDSGWATTVQSITQEQMDRVDQAADAMNQTFQTAMTQGGSKAVVEAQAQATKDLADEIAGLAEVSTTGTNAWLPGDDSSQILGRRQAQAFERYAEQTLGLTEQEAKEYVTIAAQQGAAAATSYVETETGAGKEAANILKQQDAQTRSDLQKAFDQQSGVFESMMPVLEDVAKSSLSTAEYVEANRASMDANAAAILDAVANPSNLGKQYLAAAATSELVTAGGPQAVAEYTVGRGNFAQGTAIRTQMDAAAAQMREDVQRNRMNMSSIQATSDVMAEGMAAMQQIAANGGQLSTDETVAQEQRQAAAAFMDAKEQRKQFMIGQITALREHNVAVTRSNEQFELQMGRQEASFYRQRGYAQEAFQRQQGYAEDDFYRSRARAIEDYHRGVARAEEDFRLSVARSYLDYYISLEREAQDHARSMARIAEDMAKSFMDPFTRVGPQQTFSTGGLLRNLEREAELAKEQFEALERLRAAGLSQQAIDQLGLAEAANARQTARMGDMTAEEIARLNAAAAERGEIGAGYRDSSVDIRRQEEDRQQALARQAEDFAKSLARADEDFQKSLLRNAEDFNRSLARSYEDFMIQTTRAQTEFTISMEQQLTEFNISVSQAREDHNTQLRYMQEDLARSGEQIHGTYEEIAKAYGEAMAGDAEAYKQVMTDNNELMQAQLLENFGQIPGNLEAALGPAAWLFGLGNFDEAKHEGWMKKWASQWASGIDATVSNKLRSLAATMGFGGEGGGPYPESGEAGEMFPGDHRVYTHSGHKPFDRDVGTPVGTPIFAPFAGTVTNKLAGGGWSSYGQYIDLAGNNKWVRVAHLSRFVGQAGAARVVQAGELIGYTGGARGVYGSGNSTGPHAHIEAKLGGQAVLPTAILKYDTGGILPHGAGAVNLSGRPEAIINDEQWRTLRHLGDEIAQLARGVTFDPRGMGLVGEVVARHVDAWEAKAARVSGYAVAGGASSVVQTYDHSTQVTGPIQVVSNDPVDMGRKIASRARARRAFQPIGGSR